MLDYYIQCLFVSAIIMQIVKYKELMGNNLYGFRQANCTSYFEQFLITVC